MEGEESKPPVGGIDIDDVVDERDVGVDASEHHGIPLSADVVDGSGGGMRDEQDDGSAGDGHGGTVPRGRWPPAVQVT